MPKQKSFSLRVPHNRDELVHNLAIVAKESNILGLEGWRCIVVAYQPSAIMPEHVRITLTLQRKDKPIEERN